MPNEKLTLRARKAAQTRLALLDAVLKRLVDGPLSGVNVAEVCAEVGISQPTFFNYFGSKSGALMFYVSLWSVEMQWHLGRAGSGREALQLLFDRTSAAAQQTPWLMREIVVYQIQSAADDANSDRVPPPSVADKRLRFGELSGVELLEPVPVQALIADALRRAVEAAELSAESDLSLANRLLSSLFFGATASQRDAVAAADTMSRGLALIWSGLGPKERTIK